MNRLSSLITTFMQVSVWLFVATLPLVSYAEITPLGGKYDPRVRVIEYNPTNVVRVSTFYGVSTHVQFSDEENITDIAVGDDQAWNIVPRGNHLFVKPKAKNADTNVTVVTNKRVYHFALMVVQRSSKDSDAWRDPALIYGLRFRYPDELTEKLVEKMVAEGQAEEKLALQQEQQEKDQARDDLLKLKNNALKRKLISTNDAAAQELIKPAEAAETATASYTKPDNNDYWAAGSKEIMPTAARDDSRFTYLTFSNNRDMPAVYSVDAFDKEALINTSVEANTIIVHRVVPLLRLRKGDAVVCIRNRAFDLDGGKDNETGTVVPGIERITLEPQ